jgi:hypothetical protein
MPNFSKCWASPPHLAKLGLRQIQISYHKACWKGYDGVDVLKWNFEVEPFVVQ